MAAIKNSVVKTCSRCDYPTSIDNFLQTKSLLYQDGRVPICNDCLKKFSNQVKDDWAKINKMCQWLDIPFIPDQYQKVYNSNSNDAFLTYARIFRSKSYENLDWTTYYQEFKKLEKENELRAQLPLFEESRIRELQQVWGENYSPEQLSYLQNLLDGIMKTQNVNGELQYDQAKKLCKISLNIEERISADAEFDKLLASYEKLVKAAEFTPKNVKSASDFESVGELFAYLEKRGFKPSYCTDVSKDIVDQTIIDIQNFCQKLYINEPSMGEEISKRIESLQRAQEVEDNYGIRRTSKILDDYDAELSNREEPEEEFSPEL